MEERFAKLAYHGKPAPETLPDSERPAYQMLCMLYQLYRSGTLDPKTAAALKGALMKYPDCPVTERAALLRFFFLTAFERARAGNGEAWDQARSLFEEYAMLPLDKSIAP